MTEDDLNEIALAIRYIVNEERMALAQDILDIANQIDNTWFADSSAKEVCGQFALRFRQLGHRLTAREDTGVKIYGDDSEN